MNNNNKCCDKPALMPLQVTISHKESSWCFNCGKRTLDGVVYTEKEWDEHFQRKAGNA